ncbi:39771_t:CDS:2, partial [Gigaspora margarita]
IVKRKAVKRTVFLYEEAKEEDWEQFRVELDRILKNKKALKDRLGLPIEETDKLKFNLTIEKINTNLQLEIQQAEDI